MYAKSQNVIFAYVYRKQIPHFGFAKLCTGLHAEIKSIILFQRIACMSRVSLCVVTQQTLVNIDYVAYLTGPHLVNRYYELLRYELHTIKLQYHNKNQ